VTATAEAVQAAPQALVDPRVAKHGGTRKSAKSHYDFPGMMDAASGARSAAGSSRGRTRSTRIWRRSTTGGRRCLKSLRRTSARAAAGSNGDPGQYSADAIAERAGKWAATTEATG
jgi:hypothetical protein